MVCGQILEKLCCRCKIVKSLTDFNKKASRSCGYSETCRECMKLYLKDHYTRNTDYYKTKSRCRKRELSDFIRSKKNIPCADCGVMYHFSAMDFDHREGSRKLWNVATLSSRGSYRLILDEIEKCDVVCANCHRVRTWKRRSEVG